MDDRLFLLKLDIGAFDAPAWRVDERYVTTIGGDAILRRLSDAAARTTWPRSKESASRTCGRCSSMARLLQPRALRPQRSPTWSLAERSGRNALDVRLPTTASWWCSRCAMRLIENLPGVRLTMDLHGVTGSGRFRRSARRADAIPRGDLHARRQSLLIDNERQATDRILGVRSADACAR